jgi:hypothetical protein
MERACKNDVQAACTCTGTAAATGGTGYDSYPAMSYPVPGGTGYDSYPAMLDMGYDICAPPRLRHERGRREKREVFVY